MNPTGWLDSASFTGARGWANAPVSIYLNGELVSIATPTTERPDLPVAGHGFEALIEPLRLKRGENEVSVRFAETGVPIGGGVKKLDLAVSPELISGYSLASVARGFWTPIDVTKTEDRIRLTGWCVAPPGVAPGTIFSDGETLHFTSDRDAKLQAQTWLPPEAPVHRFEAQFKFGGPTLKLSFGADGRAFNPDHDFLIPRELSLQPERERIRRVSGGFDSLKFDMQGMTTADRLRSVFARHGRAPLAEATVLDWGVGAGRVARFLAPHAGAFHGVDVDADNLAWCRDNLRGAYRHIETDPPTPLPSGQFDLIYGISVVTHLTREYEEAWLAELRRLVKDDGVVLLSIHGPTALMVMGFCHRHADLTAEGFVDLGENKILAGRVPDGYYRNVAHSFAHLHSVWGEFFQIADILPGAIGLQDLVVLRPRVIASLEDPSSLSEPFDLRIGGFCPICERETAYTADGPRLRNTLTCTTCPGGSLPRERAVALVLNETRPNWRSLAIHECSPAPRGISVKMREQCANYVATNFFPNRPVGSLVLGQRNENLERQTFADESFDLVITVDVFEHLFDPAAAMREIHRTLKPGGACISAFPIVKRQGGAARWRARRSHDGAIEYIEEEQYHGNPINPKGSLVTVDYGYDVHQLFAQWAPFDVRVLRFADRRAGVLGELTDVLVCEKR